MILLNTLFSPPSSFVVQFLHIWIVFAFHRPQWIFFPLTKFSDIYKKSKFFLKAHHSRCLLVQTVTVPSWWSQLPINRYKMPVLSLLQVTQRSKLLTSHTYMHLIAGPFLLHPKNPCLLTPREPPRTRPQSHTESEHLWSVSVFGQVNQRAQWVYAFQSYTGKHFQSWTTHPDSYNSTDKLICAFLMYL